MGDSNQDESATSLHPDPAPEESKQTIASNASKTSVPRILGGESLQRLGAGEGVEHFPKFKDDEEKGGKVGTDRSSKANKEDVDHHWDCFTLVFGTRNVIRKAGGSRESILRVTLVELIIYILYLTVFLTAVYGSYVPTTFYYTRVISDLFLDTPFESDQSFQTSSTYRTSTNVKDFWDFTETAMPNGLYWELWYDDDQVKKPVLPQDEGILYENRLMGQARLRQIRVKSVKCSTEHLVRVLNGKCFPDYSPEMEETKPYNDTLNGTAWRYHSPAQLNGQTFWGELATYSGGGAFVLLGKTKNETDKIIKDLKQNRWVNRATRVVFLEFTVYNANINMFCVVNLAWEFSIAGSVVPSWTIRAVRLLRYVSAHDFVILAFEILFLLFTIYYTLQAIFQLAKLGFLEYWSDLWSYVDIVILVLSYTCIGLTIYRDTTVQSNLKNLTIDEGFAEFDILAFWEYTYWNLAALCIFFALMKSFKYISFNETMLQLSVTLTRCAKDIGAFSILFFIVFVAFAQLGYLLFGTQVNDYKSFHDAVFSLLKVILGEVDFQALEEANGILGPLYFMFYVFFVFFVLLNMFLAIINDAYTEVKSEILQEGTELQMGEYLQQKCCCGSAKGRKSSLALNPNDPVLTEDGKITATEIRKHLLRAKFNQMEVELFLERYELNQNIYLDDEETNAIIDGLEKGETAAEMRAHRVSTSKGHEKIELPTQEMDGLDKRITTMEASITGILAKMETIIAKPTKR